MQRREFEKLLAATRKAAVEVAAPHAAEVDALARFPHEAIAAIRELENHAVRAAFLAAIESARDRSRELAGG